jgi:D-amino-acid dehydrogenase
MPSAIPPKVPRMSTDVIVLGAGMVGVSAALHLQKRGRSVVLIDRRGAAEETSFGNAGLIQVEGVVPYPFPRDVGRLAKYAFNMLPEANLHWTALPKLAPWLVRYFLQSDAAGMARTAAGAKPIVERCIVEHEALMRDAGVEGMMRRTGYLRLYRSQDALAAAIAKETVDRETYGVNFKPVDGKALQELEPHLSEQFAGGLLMPDPASVPDPGALGKAYADLLVKRGAKFLRGEARTLERVANGWQVLTADGPIIAREVVIALGPWSDDMLKKFGFWIPLGAKRGYHMHYKAKGNATLNRPVLDTDNGYVLAPMTRGIRLTTGAEFARRDSPPSPVQLAKVEPAAKRLFPLDTRVDDTPWMGVRPCLPDMLPAIGPIPGLQGLWADFGHHHLGFTMGPVTGRLLAEMMTGETPFTDPKPYRPERFA